MFPLQVRPPGGNACQEEEEWLLSSDTDSDMEELLPLAARLGARGVPPATGREASAAGGGGVDDGAVAQLVEMGFTPKQALKVTFSLESGL